MRALSPGHPAQVCLRAESAGLERFLLSFPSMKVAIPQWQDRVSPVFDTARKALLADLTGGHRARREMACVRGTNPVERAQSLSRLGVEVLICGAISRPMEVALMATGIRVVSNTCGRIEDVLTAFREGRLDDEAFRMPGTGGRKIGSHRARTRAW